MITIKINNKNKFRLTQFCKKVQNHKKKNI